MKSGALDTMYMQIDLKFYKNELLEWYWMRICIPPSSELFKRLNLLPFQKHVMYFRCILYLNVLMIYLQIF